MRRVVWGQKQKEKCCMGPRRYASSKKGRGGSQSCGTGLQEVFEWEVRRERPKKFGTCMFMEKKLGPEISIDEERQGDAIRWSLWGGSNLTICYKFAKRGE